MTNDERYEVARRLREIDFEGTFDLNEKMEMVGDIIGDPFSVMLMNDFTNRLADLIEPELEQTCYDKEVIKLASDSGGPIEKGETVYLIDGDGTPLTVVETPKEECYQSIVVQLPNGSKTGFDPLRLTRTKPEPLDCF